MQEVNSVPVQVQWVINSPFKITAFTTLILVIILVLLNQ
jgi:hypothetical protein